MTLSGEWDQPVFVCWHWLKWMDAYIGVLDTGQVPHLVDVASPGPGARAMQYPAPQPT
jgi:hypothetical protein